MSVAHLLPEGSWHRAWVRALEHARTTGDLEACLDLRREDAEHSGLSERTLHLALNEERDWHTKHGHQPCTGPHTGPSTPSPTKGTSGSTSS